MNILQFCLYSYTVCLCKEEGILDLIYSGIQKGTTSIKEYLIAKGVDGKEIIFSAIEIDQEFEYFYDKNNNRNKKFTGYRLKQIVQIESKNVDKIEDISRQVIS